MTPRAPLILLASALLLGLLAFPAPASAARKAPRGFFGVVHSQNLAPLPNPSDRVHLRRMRRAGVESVRFDFSWHVLEPSPGGFRWDLIDPFVRLASQNRLDILPIVSTAPQWASSRPDREDFAVFAPDDPSLYGNFLRALIGRYGPAGSFWAENPGVPRRPIRQWQIWNEPSASYFWGKPNYRRTYPELLRAAYRAVHDADPGATVVMAGLASFLQEDGRTQTRSWDDLAAFFRNGIRGSFDALAIHPFSRELGDVVQTVRLHRRVLRRNRNGRKPIWLTELSWQGSKGLAPPSNNIQVTPRQQRKRMAAAYKTFVTTPSLRVRRTFWFSWSSTYSPVTCGGRAIGFQYVGLVRTPCRSGSLTPMPLLRVFSRAARRY